VPEAKGVPLCQLYCVLKHRSPARSPRETRDIHQGIRLPRVIVPMDDLARKPRGGRLGNEARFEMVGVQEER
jgi:hypothetical protein